MARPVSQGGIDYPDGGFSGGTGGFPMIGDLAELAARLGSISTYDRRGTIIWMTDFEHGLQGTSCGVSDAECDYFVSAERSYHGAYSLKMDPSDEEDSYVEWGWVVHFMPSGYVGLEAAISTVSDPAGIRLKILHFDGTTQQRGELHYDTATGDWTIRTGDTTWETILDGFKLQQGAAAWNPIKLIIDVESGEYVRAQMSGRSVDISDYSLYSLASTNLGQVAVRVMTYGASTTHAPAFVDNIIVTQNES
jgi:hypothetical protein